MNETYYTKLYNECKDYISNENLRWTSLMYDNKPFLIVFIRKNIENTVDDEKRDNIVNIKYALFSFSGDIEILDIVNKLEWEVVNVEESQLVIIPIKEYNSTEVEYAKDNGIKVMTLSQVKLIFVH